MVLAAGAGAVMHNFAAITDAGKSILRYAAAVPIAACLLVTPSAAGADCTLDIPLPPDPLPNGFDWTPLAIDWCDQLAACGYPTVECVSDYLSAVASEPPPPASPPADDGTLSAGEAFEMLGCEDSEEYAAGIVSCIGDVITVPALDPIGLTVLTLALGAALFFRRSRDRPRGAASA